MSLARPPGLTGAEAFLSLSQLIRGNSSGPAPSFANSAHARLARAIALLGRRDAASPSPADLTALVRHVLRHEAQQAHNQGSASLTVPLGSEWPTPDAWRQVGVDAVPVDGGLALAARPWQPSWLPDVPQEGADGTATATLPRNLVPTVPADPLLSASHGFPSYRSRAQRAAVRAALTTPPGATGVVLLPTGEGKSLVFQLLARYLPTDPRVLPGVTLVITPTTALALDQGRAAEAAGFPAIPRVYIGAPENAEDNRRIWQGIASGTQGLCFASPEAACRSLRVALLRAAEAGLLHAIVVDEAHMVDTWGSNFRPYFQLLAGLRRQMLAIAPPGSQPRTMLLSATITPAALSTLHGLFGTDPYGNPTPFALCGGMRLRPEIELWATTSSSVIEQRERVLEALRHLPRPAILYVTRVQSAEDWRACLRGNGYARIACVTGSTPFVERLAVIDRWRDGTLDLVVATSAFGLGIDYPHVRTIIHACLPESLDRFYQEVGRAGRDGCASVALLIPWRDHSVTGAVPATQLKDDFDDAKRLSGRRLISVRRGLVRWKAMFGAARHIGAQRAIVALHSSPGTSARDIDMVGPGNTMWNARTVALMASAGLIALEAPSPALPSDQAEAEPVATSDDVSPLFVLPGAEEPTDEQAASPDTAPNSEVRTLYQGVRIVHHGHADLGPWEQHVEPLRQRLEAASRDSLRAIESLVEAQAPRCAADALVNLYRLPAGDSTPEVVPALTCGGCPTCRRMRIALRPEAGAPLPHPWVPSVPTRVHNLVDSHYRLLLLYPAEVTDGDRRRILDALKRLTDIGFHQFFIHPDMLLDVSALQEGAPAPLFVTHNLLDPHGLPPGPTVYVAPRHCRLVRAHFEGTHPADNPRVYVLPEDYKDPARPLERLSATYVGAITTIDEFL